MRDGGEGVDLVAVQQDVDLDEAAGLLARGFVVQGGVTARLGLQLVEEVEDDLREREGVADLDPVLGEVVHAEEGAAALLTQLHDRADELGGREHGGPDDRLEHVRDLALGELARVGDGDFLAVLHDHPVDHVRRGGDQVEAELALQTLTDHVQVEQAEEADAEAEAERRRGLRLVDERGVVELQLVQGLAQVRVVRAVERIEAREDHRPRVLVAAEGLGGAVVQAGDGVTDLGLTDVLHAGDDVAHLADADAVGRGHLRGGDTDLQQLVGGAGGHHPDALALVQLPVDHTDVRDDATVRVVDGVEDHGAGRGVLDADRGRDRGDDLVEQRLDTETGLRRDAQHVLGLAADEVRELLGKLLRLGGRQVDLVQDGDDREVVLHRQVQVGEGLRLDALGCVHQEDGALARGEGTRDLVGEVDVPGGVDHVEDVGVALTLARGGCPGQPDRLGLDRDAALTLDVHAVEVLGAHLPLVDHTGDLEHPVGKGRLAVVDVRDDAEVADQRRVGTARLGHVAGDRGHAVS